MENLYACILEEMKDFTPIPSMDLFLYETGMEKSPIYDKNQGIMVNVVNMIGRLIQECLNLIQKVLGSIRNCVDYVFLSKEKKQRYQSYCAYLKTHPEIGKKKVSVADWKKVEAYYDRAIKRADNLSRRVASKQISREAAKKEERDIMDSLNNVVGKCSSIVTLDVALQLASGSTESAKMIQRTMTTNQQLMQRMANDLGVKEVRNFQKKVAKMTKDTYFTRMKTMILGKEQKDITESINQMLSQVGNLDSFDGRVQFAKTHKKALTQTAKQLSTDKEFRKDVQNVVKHGKQEYVKHAATIQGLKRLKEDFLG